MYSASRAASFSDISCGTGSASSVSDRPNTPRMSDFGIASLFSGLHTTCAPWKRGECSFSVRARPPRFPVLWVFVFVLARRENRFWPHPAAFDRAGNGAITMVDCYIVADDYSDR